MLNRRELLRQIGLGAVATSLPGVCFAKADTEARFVLVVLRGAADGLAIAAPYGEGRYQRLRGELAISKPGASNGLLKLDGLFTSGRITLRFQQINNPSRRWPDCLKTRRFARIWAANSTTFCLLSRNTRQ